MDHGSCSPSNGPTLTEVANITRKEFLIGAASLLLFAPGCSTGGGGGGSGENGSGGGSGGKRSLRHKYGSTQIEGSPKRIVTVGITDQDAVLALGVKPVGIGEWFGEYPSATWPWAQDELGDAKPEVLPSTELDFERIAALEPDLILSLNSGLTKQDYETLSEIAPTVAQPKGYIDYGIPWQEQTRITGRALDREGRAEDLVAGLEKRFAKAREENPAFEGSGGVVVGANGSGDSYVPAPYTGQDVRGRFMEALGFEQPAELRELAGESFFTELSRERLRLIDTDVVVWVDLGTGLDPVKNDPLYDKLDVAKEGRDVFLEDKVLNGALSFGTVLSLPFALDGLVPRISAAIDGDPET